MKINTWIEKLYQAAQNSGADEFQIIYLYTEERALELLSGNINTSMNSENQTVAIMLKKDGKIGCCESRNLDEIVIPEMIDSAIRNANIIDKAEENFFYDGKDAYASAEPYHPLAQKMASLNPIEFIKEVEKEILKADTRILPSTSVSFYTYKQKRIIKNSLGVNIEEEREKASSNACVLAQDGKYKENGWKSIYFDKKEDFNPSYLAKKAVEKAVSHLNGIKPESGPARVVFAPESLVNILQYLGHCLSAEKINKKQSQFAEKLGKTVASSIVTIIEDPLLKGGYRTSSFDNEGVPTYKKELISKGVLKTYLYSLKTAHQSGVKPTGNDADNQIGSNLRNVYIEKGTVSKEDLLKKVEKGIYIDGERGFIQGIRTNTSGDFSFSASGFLIENGEIGQPLEQFTVAGNYYQMFKDIKLIANDLEFQFNGVGSPTIWVDGLVIGGK